MPQKPVQTIDWILYLVVFILVGLGILVIYSISYGGETQYLFWDQMIFAGIGFVLMAAFTLFDYRILKGIYLYLYIGGLFLLVVVLFFGKITGGAARWIDFGFFQLQPSEIFKFILIITLASFFSELSQDFKFRHFIVFLVLITIPIVLVLGQPDFGTALVLLVVSVSMLVAAKIKAIYLFILGSLGLILVPLSWFILKNYQKERLITFLNPKADPFGAGYNVLQSTIAVGSGMLKGRGFGEGFQSHLKFLPAPHTDFIFAVFAEEFGFVGAILLIVIFLILVLKILKIAKIAADNFGMLICLGVISLILFQVLVNIGMNIGIMPVTGIPLPFVSYGGTSLIVGLILIGILQSIIIRHKKLTFG